jgi:hypothetical protein
VQTTMEDPQLSTRSLPTLPTLPCSVVWSGGHSYVLERLGGSGTRWVGLDERGRPLALTSQDLQRRGWTLYPS